MKKKIFGGIAFVAVALIVAFNLSINSQKDELSEIAFANVEALAQESTSTYQGTTATCSQTVVTEYYTTTESGWSWNIGLNVWFFDGKASKAAPSNYTKATTTTNSSWQGCKPQGSTTCTAPPC